MVAAAVTTFLPDWWHDPEWAVNTWLGLGNRYPQNPALHPHVLNPQQRSFSFLLRETNRTQATSCSHTHHLGPLQPNEHIPTHNRIFNAMFDHYRKWIVHHGVTRRPQRRIASLVPHKPMAEVSKEETYRRGWLLWIMASRANPLVEKWLEPRAIYQTICLSISLPVFLFIYLSTYLPIYLSSCLAI